MHTTQHHHRRKTGSLENQLDSANVRVKSAGDVGVVGQGQDDYVKEFFDDEDEFKDIDPQYLEYIQHDTPIQMLQSKIYELILKNVYMDYVRPITFPPTMLARIKYIFLFPHIILHNISVPNPMVEN